MDCFSTMGLCAYNVNISRKLLKALSNTAKKRRALRLKKLPVFAGRL